MKIVLFLVSCLVLGIVAWQMDIFTSAEKVIDRARTGKPQETSFDKTKYSIAKPDSLWVVVNKRRKLSPETFVPSNLVGYGTTNLKLAKPAAQALSTLIEAAKKENIDLKLVSGYRSYYDQKGIYESEVKGFGQKQADRESARPGHSEHQTGLAADLGNASGDCQLKICFGDSAGGKWVAKNAWRYGFIIRYKKGAEKIVGYQYEPWHLRYVGRELASEINKANKTMEEFFELSAAPDYK